MYHKASSATFAALAATLLISSTPVAHATTFLNTTPEATIPIPSDFTVTGDTLTAGPLSTFTDVTFTVDATASPSTSIVPTNAIVTVTGTGSDGVTSNNFPFAVSQSTSPVSQDLTLFTAPAVDLTSVSISAVPSVIAGNGTVSSAITFTGVSGLQVIPLPATLPLFASGLGALGLLGRRRKRKSTTSVLANV